MSRSMYVLTPLSLSITPALPIAAGLLFVPLPALAAETLFRLMLTRPPVAQLEEAPSIAMAQDSDFQKAILQATTSPNPREALKTAARTFVATSTFVGNPQRLGLYQPLRKLALGLDSLQKNPVVTNDDVARRIEGAFGAKPANLVQNKTLEKPMEALRDSILAIKLLPEEHRRPLSDLTNQLRDLEVILKVASDSSFPGDGNALRRYRNRSLQLPTDLALLSILSTTELQLKTEKERKEREAKKRKEVETALDRYRRLKAAIDELSELSSDLFESTPQKEIPGGKPPTTTPAKPGGPAFNPLLLNLTTFRLKPSAEQTVSAQTIAVLKERGLNIAARPLDQMIAVLRAELAKVTKQLESLLGRSKQQRIQRVGNTIIVTTTPAPPPLDDLERVGQGQAPPDPPDSRVPQSHGKVAAIGVADLLVVKQQLVRYEGGDIAHVENIVKGELKSRDHTARKQSEQLTFRESEKTTSEERESASANRLEMTRETNQTIKEDASLKAGLNLSGKYGPSVQFAANAEGTISRSREEATKAATSFSQDVTQRSATKVAERVLERSVVTLTSEVIEKNTHTLDNVKGGGHISALYQWLNKVYQAQMYNYGVRAMYEFMVPSPGAFLVAALQRSHAKVVQLEKPLAFPLQPDQITEMNYHEWVLQYGATNIAPPPELFRTMAKDFKVGGAAYQDYTHSVEVLVDDGYMAVYATVGATWNWWDIHGSVNVIIGSRAHAFGEGRSWVWSTALDEERGSVAFALGTWGMSQVAGVVEVKTKRTERALLKWKLDTHTTLTQAYKARLSEYEERLAALEAQAGVTISGKNPVLNLELMKEELKKNCITILTAQQFELFDAISVGETGLPQINLVENEAEGPYVRFFEQAFEWEQMTWITYPYFWGRKGEWEDRVGYDDSDPIFNQFVKAGYARVSVPARPGFEVAIDHFMTIGEIWNGGPLPAISSPLYVPIADEIAERLDKPGEETPQGDPWSVLIPTNLVRLRPDDKLPRWKQDANNNWVEDSQ